MSQGVPLIYIVLLNWNGWQDTLACVESLLGLRGVSYRIVVCDNASDNDSVAHIRAWCAGREPSPALDERMRMRLGTWPARPLRLVEYTRPQAEAGGAVDDEADIFLLHNGANLGFAGGCNVGIRFATARGDADYVWLLNNDTVVEPVALRALVDRAQSDPSFGIVGSTLCFFDAPDTVQAYAGGTFDADHALSTHIGEGDIRHDLDAAEVASVESRMVYVIGASMLVSRPFLQAVGLMQEDYFLYFEEIDWAERARRHAKPFRLGFASGSVVYHKVGASAGTHARSVLSVRYYTRNRLRFLKRFYPAHLGAARRWLFWEGVRALLRGRLTAAHISMRVAVSPVQV